MCSSTIIISSKHKNSDLIVDSPRKQNCVIFDMMKLSVSLSNICGRSLSSVRVLYQSEVKL